MLLAEAIDQFLNHVLATRKPATERHYRERLQGLRKLHGTSSIDSLTTSSIEQHFAQANHWPDGRPKAPDTIRANIIAWEQLQAFLLQEQLIPQALTGAIAKPSGQLRERLPTKDEIARILAAAVPAFALIYRALRLSGCRPSELAKATFADWDQREGVISLADHKTATKSKRPRRIAVGDKLLEYLRLAIGDRTEGPLFLTSQGKPWTSARLSQEFRRTRERAGLSKDLVLYLTRHEHATQLCEKLDLNAAAEALGHASLNTTRRYLHLSAKKLKANQDLFEE
ncbi:integrase family protein (plasmid) [Planctopirus limnophila DSM 3776]|uniref:Integrase family protein n=1 Tax=Planctopirus limnophila (strain ATCC 43296 / DSM 3776 / IFAM 1008 / Mu 290) TaxID=521674 RepID=D5SZF9_PLAL2|nr:site-specific integrase [Planctopirus limnophila]ADG70079.1 integrase family protein [Planctopirus limnophila DSM 3776]